MPMLSQGMVTPRWVRDREKQEQKLSHGNNDGESELALEQRLHVLTRHSTQMPQNGSRVIGEDSEIPSMSEQER